MTPDQLFHVSREIVLLTGVSGQLGDEYARAFLECGARVTGLDVRSSASSDALSYDNPNQYLFCDIDVTNKPALQRALKGVEQQFGTPADLPDQQHYHQFAALTPPGKTGHEDAYAVTQDLSTLNAERSRSVLMLKKKYLESL